MSDDEDALTVLAYLLGGEAPKTCVHGFDKPHTYSPVGANGFVYDVAVHCEGKSLIGIRS